MEDIIIGLAAVIIFFIVGFIAGYYIMSYYFGRRFKSAIERCRDDDSFEPIIDEMQEIA
jgi:ABC-type dipeptide/oligopeptide/nickel transport system permease subunit